MRFLKTLVIGMGMLIIVGVVFVAVLISKKMSSTSVQTPPLSITLPRGAVAGGFSHDETTLAVWDKTQNRIFIYNRKDGQLMQEVVLKPAD